MVVLQEKFGSKQKKEGEEEETKDVENKTVLHSESLCMYYLHCMSAIPFVILSMYWTHYA